MASAATAAVATAAVATAAVAKPSARQRTGHPGPVVDVPDCPRHGEVTVDAVHPGALDLQALRALETFPGHHPVVPVRADAVQRGEQKKERGGGGLST